MPGLRYQGDFSVKNNMRSFMIMTRGLLKHDLCADIVFFFFCTGARPGEVAYSPTLQHEGGSQELDDAYEWYAQAQAKSVSFACNAWL